MKTVDNSSKKREITSLLFVIFSGLIGALLLTLAMTLYYTTEGTYRATNVVLEPALLPSLRYIDQQTGRGDKSLYVYDKTTYMFFDPAAKQLLTVNLTQDQYKKIYEVISSDTSIRYPQEDIKQLFSGPQSPSLAIVMKNPTHQALYTLMRIEIASDGNYYRVQLRGNDPIESWAYFFHGNISEKLKKIVKNE